MSRAQLSLGLHRGWQTSLEMRVSKQGRVRIEGPGREGHVRRQPREKWGWGFRQKKTCSWLIAKGSGTRALAPAQISRQEDEERGDSQTLYQNVDPETGEMAQWLKALVDLPGRSQVRFPAHYSCL